MIKFKRFNNIGKEEIKAVNKVLKTGILSQYLGDNSKDFYGGKNVRMFEKKWAKYFKVKYAAAVNSWSSGLTCSVGAINIEPGDEIILPTLTMTACAAAVLHWNAIPVFADVDSKTYTISLDSIKKNYSKRTKAIMAVDMFGLSSDINPIMEFAKRKKIKVITDSAQAIGSIYHKKYTGTSSHVGGYSLNYHKHIHTGEGGICVTNDIKIYKKIIHIRNHGEAVNNSLIKEELINNLGNNFRLGEIESAIGIQQLKKLKKIVYKIQNNAKILNTKLKKLKGIETPFVPNNQTHAYYVYAIKINDDLLKLYKRPKIIKELKKLGVFLREGCSNLHIQNIYQKRTAYGKRNFPWVGINNKKSFVSYKKGICPVAEKLKDKSMIALLMTEYDYSKKDIIFICKAFEKVWNKLKINEKLADFIKK